VGDANSCSFAACALHLRHLLRASPHPGGYFKRSSKIDLHLRSGSGCYSPIIMDLPNSGERDSICARLESAMKQRLWEVATAGDVVKKRLEASGVPSSVGVAGILERQRAAQEATKDIASEAFSDLKSLMAQAKDVVAVIDRYAAALRRKRADEEKGKEGEEANGAAAELGSALLSIGIVNPVTKASAGTKTEYHAMLAEQLAEFLLSRGLLARFGGTLTLTDVYAIFNRARGTELISPHDLLTVCALLQPMGLGLLLRRFPR
jgi:ESCRT-II complex subunit VPS36